MDILKLFSFQLQNDNPVLWASVETEAKLRLITVFMTGTGCDMAGYSDYPYIDTVQHMSGFVGHFFFKWKELPLISSED